MFYKINERFVQKVIFSRNKWSYMLSLWKKFCKGWVEELGEANQRTSYQIGRHRKIWHGASIDKGIICRYKTSQRIWKTQIEEF